MQMVEYILKMAEYDENDYEFWLFIMLLVVLLHFKL